MFLRIGHRFKVNENADFWEKSQTQRREVQRRAPQISDPIVMPTGFCLETPTAPPLDEVVESDSESSGSDFGNIVEHSEEILQNKINFYLGFIRNVREELGNPGSIGGATPSDVKNLARTIVNSRENPDVAQDLITKIEAILMNDQNCVPRSSPSRLTSTCDTTTGESSTGDSRAISSMTSSIVPNQFSVLEAAKGSATDSVFITTNKMNPVSFNSTNAIASQSSVPEKQVFEHLASSNQTTDIKTVAPGPLPFPPPLPSRPPPVLRSANPTSTSNPTTTQLRSEFIDDLRIAIEKKIQLGSKGLKKCSSVPHSPVVDGDPKPPRLPRRKPEVPPKSAIPKLPPPPEPRLKSYSVLSYGAPVAPRRRKRTPKQVEIADDVVSSMHKVGIITDSKEMCLKKATFSTRGVPRSSGDPSDWYIPPRPILPTKKEVMRKSLSLSSIVGALEKNIFLKKKRMPFKSAWQVSQEEATQPRRDPEKEELSSCAWYHPITPLQKLSEMDQDGAFLVRPSSKVGEGIPFTISVTSGRKIFNCDVTISQNGKYILGNAQGKVKGFDTVSELIRFHETTPALLEVEGSPEPISVLFLKTPEKYELLWRAHDLLRSRHRGDE